jgi:hypothetical protein
VTELHQTFQRTLTPWLNRYYRCSPDPWAPEAQPSSGEYAAGVSTSVVTHTTGTLRLDDGALVAEMSGTRGLFRKEAWSKEDRIPLAKLTAIQLDEESNKTITLSVRTLASGDRGAVAYMRCGPAEALEELVEAVVDANPNITVNHVDMKDEISRLRREQRERDDEIVGVDRRVTLTRLALGGVVGGLLFKKREVVRRKDVR